MEKDLALQKFNAGYNCAQSVLFQYSKSIGMDSNTAVKIATGFGGGMGRMQEVCGAVTGGILVLGMRHGRGSKDERPAMEVTYAKTRELMERFSEHHGSCICRVLLNGCDPSTEEGKKQFKEKDLLNTVCRPCVQTVIELLEGEASRQCPVSEISYPCVHSD